MTERALAVFKETQSFAAGVDVDSVDHRGFARTVTRAKETWHFSRVQGTNTLVRRRYLPFAGKEVIDSEKYAGGRLLAEKTVRLPESLSLPGFEVCNLLLEMLAAGPVIEKQEGGSFQVAAHRPAGGTLRAWFAAGAVVPRRVERRQDDALISVITRTASGADDHALPSHDTLIFYEGGRIATTVSRSYSNAEEASGSSSPTNTIRSIQFGP